MGICCNLPNESFGYYANGYWSTTALDGATGPVGTSVNVTWSIAPDGTFIPGEGGSNLVSFFDSLFPGGSGSDLTQRPWFYLLEASVNRWSELSGATLHYEPADDGTNLRGLGGVAGVRGDIRLGGAFIDGTSGTLASTSFLPDADITFDTADGVYYSNPLPSDTYQQFKNTFTHELGHALGLGHIESNNAVFLMEPFTNNGIHGPQLDDIRGIHHLYGDFNEKSNSGLGNETLATATALGTLIDGQPLVFGIDAATGNFVLPGETDFVSISNAQDVDYYAFEIAGPSTLNLDLSPLGTTYNERIGSSGPYTSTNA